MVITTADAISFGHDIWKNIEVNAGGTGITSEPVVNNQAKVNSFHAVMKLIAAVAANPGAATRHITRQNA